MVSQGLRVLWVGMVSSRNSSRSRSRSHSRRRRRRRRGSNKGTIRIVVLVLMLVLVLGDQTTMTIMRQGREAWKGETGVGTESTNLLSPPCETNGPNQCHLLQEEEEEEEEVEDDSGIGKQAFCPFWVPVDLHCRSRDLLVPHLLD